MAALVTALHEKGILTRQEILTKIQEIRRRQPQVGRPAVLVAAERDGLIRSRTLPRAHLSTETVEMPTMRILELPNHHKLSAHQAKTLLDPVKQHVGAGEQVARRWVTSDSKRWPFINQSRVQSL